MSAIQVDVVNYVDRWPLAISRVCLSVCMSVHALKGARLKL